MHKPTNQKYRKTTASNNCRNIEFTYPTHLLFIFIEINAATNSHAAAIIFYTIIFVFQWAPVKRSRIIGLALSRFGYCDTVFRMMNRYDDNWCPSVGYMRLWSLYSKDVWHVALELESRAGICSHACRVRIICVRMHGDLVPATMGMWLVY